MSERAIRIETELGTLTLKPSTRVEHGLKRKDLKLLVAKAAEDLNLAEAGAWFRTAFGERKAGEALRGLREVAGLSLRDFSKRCGVPYPHLSEMERAKRPIGLKMARKLARALGVRYELLLAR